MPRRSVKPSSRVSAVPTVNSTGAKETAITVARPWHKRGRQYHRTALPREGRDHCRDVAQSHRVPVARHWCHQRGRGCQRCRQILLLERAPTSSCGSPQRGGRPLSHIPEKLPSRTSPITKATGAQEATSTVTMPPRFRVISIAAAASVVTEYRVSAPPAWTPVPPPRSHRVAVVLAK